MWPQLMHPAGPAAAPRLVTLCMCAVGKGSENVAKLLCGPPASSARARRSAKVWCPAEMRARGRLTAHWRPAWPISLVAEVLLCMCVW
jgi:hypothetical protein